MNGNENGNELIVPSDERIARLLLDLAHAYETNVARWQALSEAQTRAAEGQAKTLRWLEVEIEQLRDEKLLMAVQFEERIRALEHALVESLSERPEGLSS